MRIKNYFFAIACALSAMTIGCTDDELVNGVIKYSGDDIVFGGQAGYEMNSNGTATRTIYTGGQWTDSETGKTYEGVNWIAGDMVRIYCPQAGGVKMADYKVNLAESDTTIKQETKPHEVQLAKTTEVSLQWSNTTEPYTFYAVYPAPGQYSGSVNATEVLNGSSKIVGEIPSVQVHKGKYHLQKNEYQYTDNKKVTKGTGTHYIVAPDMKYAYMVAKTTVADPNKSAESVYLQFMPIATAVEITLQNLATADNYENGYTFNLANVFVSSANGEPIYGTFEKDLNDLTDSNDDDVFADAVGDIAVKSGGGTQINLPMNEDGLNGNPIALKYGDKITFTVFILPTQDLSNLKVTIQGVGGTRTANINGIKILKQKKNYLTNIPLTGDVLPFTQAEWIKYVEDEAPLSELSIPGAGGAASGEKNSDGAYTVTSAGQRQQNLNIEELWNKGIRCFEFATDCDGGGTDLGEEYIICNGVKCAIQLKTAVSAVVKQLNDHPNEFAMVILGYQTLSGWDARTPATYMTMLNDYWPKVKSQLTTREDGETLGLYDPTSITGDVRGKLFCIARPTSIYQDYGTNIVTGKTEGFIFQSDAYYTKTSETAYPTLEDPVDGILVIKGWGNLKDKWQQRGYTTFSRRQTYAIAGEETTTTTDGKPGRPFDPSTLTSATRFYYDVEWDGGYWSGKLPSTDYTTNPEKFSFSKLSPNFTYDLRAGTADLDKKAWVQEWARVSNSNDILTISSTSSWGTTTRKIICWNSTRDEKIGNIQDAMRKALDKPTGYSVFINSLCGYYVSQAQDAYKQSLLPCLLTDYNMSNGEVITSAEQSAGLGGDIATFAADMNQVFYDYLQGITTDANGNSLGVGPMGIVLMDRVGDDKYSTLIPGIIVANNFKQAATVTTPAEGQSVLSEQATLTVNSGSAEEVTARSLSDSPAEQEMTITWE